MEHLRVKNIFFLLFFLLFFSGCGKNLPKQLVNPPSSSALLGSQVRGSLFDTNNNSINLAAIQKPLVLVFSQETCIVCIEEAKHFREHLANPTVEPSSVSIITVIVGADAQIAREWKDTWLVPWTVVYDENLTVFSQYCAQRLTPCTIVATPLSGIVFTKMGPVLPSEIEPYTGPWN